ncbi:MAG: TIM barrel protein [Acidobacteria bacterium]|nr:TIM barrel protein [Acidobacteriota bacterium]
MLRFGTAGIPNGVKSYEKGFELLRERGLDSLEVEFVYGVRMPDSRAEEVGQLARKQGIVLTCHGPYYINLNAAEPEKLEASIRRVKRTIHAGRVLGAVSVTFHAGFYLKQDPEAVLAVIRQRISEIMADEKIPGTPQVAPETTGKPSQFGSLEELLQVVNGQENMSVCIDFAHLHARSIGRYNTGKETESVLRDVVRTLGEAALSRMHFHMAGIVYGPKGEKHHVNLAESDFNFPEILRVLKSWDVGGVVTCESPNLQDDACLLKETYSRY